jgi:dGTPase
MVFKTEFTRTMIDEAAAQYGDGRDIASGEKVSLLADTDADELLELLKANARGYLYPADKVQRPFLAGGKVVRGVLDEYSSLLKLSQEQFTLLRRAWKAKDRREVRENQLETLLPLLDSLPAHYLEVYDHMVTGDSKAEETGAETWEWFCRAHLIVDYLSGMSDDFAFRTYQVMSGVQLD